MNKLLGLVVIYLLWLTPVNAKEYISDEKCSALAGDAKTDWAAEQIIDDCSYQKKVTFSFQYDRELKCAIKAGKARTETAAEEIYDNCY